LLVAGDLSELQGKTDMPLSASSVATLRELLFIVTP